MGFGEPCGGPDYSFFASACPNEMTCVPGSPPGFVNSTASRHCTCKFSLSGFDNSEAGDKCEKTGFSYFMIVSGVLVCFIYIAVILQMLLLLWVHHGLGNTRRTRTRAAVVLTSSLYSVLMFSACGFLLSFFIVLHVAQTGLKPLSIAIAAVLSSPIRVAAIGLVTLAMHNEIGIATGMGSSVHVVFRQKVYSIGVCGSFFLIAGLSNLTTMGVQITICASTWLVLIFWLSFRDLARRMYAEALAQKTKPVVIEALTQRSTHITYILLLDPLVGSSVLASHVAGTVTGDDVYFSVVYGCVVLLHGVMLGLLLWQLMLACDTIVTIHATRRARMESIAAISCANFIIPVHDPDTLPPPCYDDVNATLADNSRHTQADQPMCPLGDLPEDDFPGILLPTVDANGMLRSPGRARIVA